MSVFADGVKELVIKRGIPCIPIPPKQKGTRLKDWPNRATTDLDQLRAWYKENPDYNIGAVATDSGVWMLDDDDGLLESRYETATGFPFPRALLKTKTHKGFHYYFPQTEKSRALGNLKKAGVFDLQQNNKYVVGPYSIHPSGDVYTVIEENDEADDTDALLDWLSGGSKILEAESSEPKQLGIVIGNVGLITIAQKNNFENYLDTHNESVTEVEYDAVKKRWVYSRDLGCPYGALHTNPKTCAQDREFYVYLSSTGPQCKCVHSSCEMTWKKYRNYLVEKSGQDYSMNAPAENELWEDMVSYSVEDALLRSDIAAITELPVYNNEILQGSWIGQLATEVADGTSLPPQLVYNVIKVGLGALVDGKVGHPAQTNLHTRHYCLNLGEADTGKSQAVTRILGIPEEAGVLSDLFMPNNNNEVHIGEVTSIKGVKLLHAPGIGSGEYLIQVLHEYPHLEVMLVYDELAELWKKIGSTGSTLKTKLLELYEKRNANAGSKTGGKYSAVDVGVHILGNITPQAFAEVFQGTGAKGDGFLSRFVLGYDQRTSDDPFWKQWDVSNVKDVKAKLIACIGKLPSSGFHERFIPDMDEAAKHLQQDFLIKFKQVNPESGYIERLSQHFFRDLLLRTVFSESQVITEAQVERSILWVEHQLVLRRKFWDEDAPKPVDGMAKKITSKFSKYPHASRADLVSLCHVTRDGRHDDFRRAMNAMGPSGTHVIRVACQNKKGEDVFELSKDTK